MPRLDDYQLVRVLAHGGMGVVHEAVERASGRRVALKRVLAGALDRDLVARFLVEGRALARLDHSGIVRVHALDEAPGGPFMVMDLVPGEPLDQVLRRDGPLAPKRATAIAAALSDALAHAHHHGVLHRDLKPANVLVRPDGEVVLIDFGLAKLQVDGGSLAHLTRTGELLGTPAFMAPEQADGRPVDARTDVYGLGATLYALLTGRAPFEGANAIAVLEEVLTREPLPPSRLRPGVTRALDEVVLACLAKDPAARPPSMRAVRERLAGDRPRGGARPGAIRAAFVAALVAAGATIAGAWWATRRPARDGGDGAAAVAPPASSSPAAVETRQSAIELAERAVRAQPGDPEAWLRLARERARHGDVAGALAPPAADAPRAAWIAHARALLSAGRPDEALSALPAGDDRELVLLRFQAAVARAERDGALASAQELPEVVALASRVAQDPTWAEGLYERERFLLLRSSDRERTERAAEALRALDEPALAERLLAAAALAAADEAAALEHLERASRRSTGAAATLHLTRGVVLNRTGRLDEADAELTRAVELDPLLLEAWRRRRVLRRAQRRFHEAAADAARDVALLGPAASTEARLEPAELLLAGGHVDDARRMLETVRGDAVSAGLLRLEGDLLWAAGDLAGATRAYEQVLAGHLPGLPNDFQRASKALAALGRPTPRWQEAYVRSLEATRDPSPWRTTAVLLQTETPDLAETAATRALELGAGVEVYSVRAAIRARLGRCWEALADRDQVVARTPRDDPTWPAALLDRSTARAAVGDLLGALEDVRAAQPLARGQLVATLARERDRLERELAALAEVAAAATHAVKGTVRAPAALDQLQAAAPYRAESARFRLVYAWTLRAIGRAAPADGRLEDAAERVLEEVEREGALPEQARALRRRFEQDEVDTRRAASDDPVARVRGLLALRRYPEAVEALRGLEAHPSALELELELARCLRAAGDLENAGARYQRTDVEEGTDAALEVILGMAEVVHDSGQTTPKLLRMLDDLRRRPGPQAGRVEVERGRALLVAGRADEALEAARRAQAHTEAALAATPVDDALAREALRGPLVEAALLRGQALRRLDRRRDARDAFLAAARIAWTLSLDDHHRLKAEVRRRLLEAFPDDGELVRAAHLAFP